MDQFNQSAQSLSWQKLYTDLTIEQSYPTLKLVEYLKSLSQAGEVINEFDFTGIQQLTDETFYALKIALSKTKFRESITRINCTGCSYITDFGVECFAKTFPCLKQVTLNGCQNITSLSLIYLFNHCRLLNSIEALSTSITWQPKMSADLCIRLNGCPLLPIQLEREAKRRPAHKMIILTNWFCSIDVINFLTADNPDISGHHDDDKPGKSSNPPKFDYRRDVKFDDIDGTFNIFQLQGLVSLHSVIADCECVYVIAMDISGMNANKNPQLHVMKRLSYIKTHASHAGVIILGLHFNDASQESESLMTDLGKSVSGCLKQQSMTLEEHLQHDAYDRPSAKTRDFYMQQRYCKSLIASNFTCKNYFFAVNRNTKQVSLRWPLSTATVTLTRMTSSGPRNDEDEDDFNLKVELKTKRLNELEKAKLKLASIKQSDISELRSIHTPNSFMEKIIEAMTVLISEGTKGKEKSNVHDAISNNTFLSDMMNYDVNKIPVDTLLRVEEIMGDDFPTSVQDEQLLESGSCISSIYQWLSAVYSYVTDCILEERVERENQKMEEAKHRLRHEEESTSKGPKAILITIKSIIEEFYNQLYLERSARLNDAGEMLKDIEDILKERIGNKIIRFEMLKANLAEKSDKFKTLYDKALGKLLSWLRIEGKILWFPGVENQPLILDLDWFTRIINKIRDEKFEIYRLNKSLFKSLAPGTLLLYEDELINWLRVDLSADDAEVFLSILTEYGLLLPAPEGVSSETEISNKIYFMREFLADKPFIRRNLEEGTISMQHFKEKVWPQVGTGAWHASDVSVGITYSFTTNMPANIVPRILSEWIKMGQVVSLWQTGCIVRCGAAAITFLRDVHGTLLTNNISAEARLTKGWTSEVDHLVLSNYLWGALSKYVLIIESVIDRYPTVHVIISLPCQGGCSRQGTRFFFPVSEIQRNLGLKLDCNMCDSDQQMASNEIVYLTGRQRFLPFHEFKPFSDRANQACPYLKLVEEGIRKNENVWTCSYCGISSDAALKITTMENQLYPSCDIFYAFEILGKSDAVLVSQTGNVISVGKATKEKKKNSAKLLLCREPLFSSGLTQVDLTVLEQGPFVLAVGSQFMDRVNPDKLDLDHCDLTFDFLSGKITSRHSFENSKDDVADEIAGEMIAVGDKLSIQVIGEEFMEMSYKDVKELKWSKTMLSLILKKNDCCFYSTCVPYKSKLGVLLQASRENASRIIINSPTFPYVRPDHFPLRSSVLYRTGVGNQWIVGYVISTTDDGIYISNVVDDYDLLKASFFPLSSKDILPVGQYSDGMSIFIGKEPMKNRDQLVKYLKAAKAFPAPYGLFKNAHQTIKDQFKNLHMTTHEPWQCTYNSSSPEVLEQSYIRYMETDGKSQKLRQEWPFVFLPSSISASTLLNPVRQVAHDWDNQDIYFICKGSEWSTLTTYQRDTHFLDLKPVKVSTDILETLVQNYRSMLILNYYTMEQRANILPRLTNIFPDLDSILGKNVLVEGLSQLMFLYRSTFLLLHAAELPSKKKFKMSKVTNDSFQAAFKALLPTELVDATSTNESVGNQRHSGLCSTHGLIARKVGLIDLTLADADQSNTQLQYSSSILHLEASTVLCDDRLQTLLMGKLQRLIHYFPNLQGISISMNNVDSIDGISVCTSLKYLIVHGHQLIQLPTEMVRLRDTIVTLDFSLGPLAALPDFICDFRNLRQLKLSQTLISELPKEIGKLVRLRTLDLAHCPIGSLPESFRKLRNLESLLLQGVPVVSSNVLKDGGTVLTRNVFNKFMSSTPAYALLTKEFVDKMWDLYEDGILSWSDTIALNETLFQKFPRFGRNCKGTKNDIYGGMPPQIFNLIRLRTLNLSFQEIRFVPSEIKRLPRLTVLIMSDNPFLETVSGEAGQCGVLNLDNCPLLRTPPKEIRDHGMKTVIAYLKRLSQGSSTCYRTKMMIVGLGGVGKTSLVQALMRGDFKSASTESDGITNGIAISSWSVKQSDQMLTFSVWDFAGQTVYYNTHQFFLSHRAVYILAWNMRHGYEHAGLDFWLSSIACHCPNSPVIIVGTHSDQVTNPQVPEDQFRKKFQNVAGFFTVSSITGQGIKELLDQLIEVTLQQPYIGEMVPEAWLSFERAILSKRNHTSLLDWNVVERLAQTAGIYGIEVKQAVYFLHDLGTLQYFDNELLRDKVVINPQWIVDVMACLVSANNAVCKNGRLMHKDIGSVWRDYPKDLHRWMLRLTEIFDLTFPLMNESANIIPCLLPPNEPEFDWPEEQPDEGVKETNVLYTFDYLPAGLFNRAQVRLYQFSDSSVIWKTGSLLKKNDHYALMTQSGTVDIQVRVIGQRSDNMVLMLHEVIEGLISQFYTGIRYKYEIPCPSCLSSNVKNMAMFSSKVLRRALERKALFLQCHKQFHTLSATDIERAILPQSAQEYDVQLQRDMMDLINYKEELTYDLFFMYCQADLPSEGQDEDKVHPYRVYLDLAKETYRCCFVDDLCQRSASEVAEAIQISKLVLVFISDDFVDNPLCQRLFKFAKDSLKKDLLLLMVGTGRQWQKSEIGLQVSSMVYVNLQKAELYDDRIVMVKDQIHHKLKPKMQLPVDADVFVSYCWMNSSVAIQAGDCRLQEGAIGHGDPRLIKQYLESNGISCWIDVERVGKMGLFADIAEGMKSCKVVVACISNEYAKSENCKMEFRFAHISLKKPIVLAVVGTGYEWESTEVGMLSLGYEKFNFQVARRSSEESLLQTVRESLQIVQNTTTTTAINREQREKAFYELFEALQRKFYRQISSYVENKEPFPCLFIIDFYSQPFDIFSTQDSEIVDAGKGEEPKEEEPITDSESDDISEFAESQARQFCTKILCEFEGGYHCVDPGLSIHMNKDDMITFFQLTAPYFARILSILRNSRTDLKIITTDEGRKLIDTIINWDLHESKDQLQSIYLALRQYMIQKDKQLQRGMLKRCYMPSGKYLWLCQEHQKLPRVTVLSSDKQDSQPLDQTASVSEEFHLLKSLTAIKEEKESAVVGVNNLDVLQLKIQTIQQLTTVATSTTVATNNNDNNYNNDGKRRLHQEHVNETEKTSRRKSSVQNDGSTIPLSSGVVKMKVTEKTSRRKSSVQNDGSVMPLSSGVVKMKEERPSRPASSLTVMKESITASSPKPNLLSDEKIRKRSVVDRKPKLNLIGLTAATSLNKMSDANASNACILL